MYTTAIVSLVAFFVALRIVGLANTVGFHRLLTHRSFKTKPWLRNTLTLVAAQYSGSPMLWVGVHRVHHTISDSPTDPHTTKHGFWYAHAGWLANTKSAPAAALFALSGFGLQMRFAVTDVLRLMGRHAPVWRKMTKDLQKEPFMRFLDVPLVMPAFFVLQVTAAWLIGHWWGIFWLWSLHLILNNGTWAVNSFCHWPGMGTSPHDTQDRSRNVGWLNYLTHGESNHNYHHEFPLSACHGLQGESDNSWGVIRLLSRLGLAWDIQLPDGYAEKLEFVTATAK
jgi:stearoyl-CoA desaturase (delta-9 desaturase)